MERMGEWGVATKRRMSLRWLAKVPCIAEISNDERGARLCDKVGRAGDGARHDVGVAVEELGGAVDDDEAQARGREQHRRGKGVVHDGRQAALPGEGCHSFQVSHPDQWVADRLHIEHLCIRDIL